MVRRTSCHLFVQPVPYSAAVALEATFKRSRAPGSRLQHLRISVLVDSKAAGVNADPAVLKCDITALPVVVTISVAKNL